MLSVQVYGLEPENWDKSALSIVVVGASGDLAKKKIDPALFALYVEVGRVTCTVLCWPALLGNAGFGSLVACLV